MNKIIMLFTSKEFLKFLITGGVAAAVNFYSRILFNYFFVFAISVILAYLIGMITAFILSKMFVFRKNQKQKQTLKQFMYFSIVNVFAVIQTLIVSLVLKEYILPTIHWNYYSDETAHLIGISIPIVSSYLGHKYFTFSKV